MNKIKRLGSKFLAFTLLLMAACSVTQIPVFAEGPTVHTATDWSQVQGLIDNAAENDIVDISALCFTTPDTTLTISKNVTIKVQPSDKPFAQIKIANLFFDISNHATLTLENVSITNTQLEKSMIRGTGNVVISKSILDPDTSYGTTTVYNAPATIDITGNVTVTTDADLYSCIVSGATIVERNGSTSGKAGIGIKAVNVTVNGGYVKGGSSYESNCDSGDAIVASGDVTIKGMGKAQAGSVGNNTENTTVGMPVRFTEDPDRQRVLSVKGAEALGSNRSNNGTAAPYTIKMSEKDIAIIDNSKIGWYTDIPVFSTGFFYITNPVGTWETLNNATEVYILTAANATLSGTKVVANEENLTHYAPQNATITIQADTPDTGKQFKEWTSVSGDIIFADPKSPTTTFAMPDSAVEVTAVYEDIPHTHTPSDTWSKDSTHHWHECTANDGAKLDVAAHTASDWIIDKEATTTEKGKKHKECTVCGQVMESAEIPMITETPEYVYIEGANSQWSANSQTGLRVKVNGDFAKFIGVKVNGTFIDESNYIAKTGSTIITLKPEYLNTLDAGVYSLAVVYTDGEAVTNFTIKSAVKPAKPIKPDSEKTNTDIKKTLSPQTGDTTKTTLLMSLLVLSGGVAVIAFKKRKNDLLKRSDKVK